MQAREDVIHMLKKENIKPEVLEAYYGSAAPENVLRLLYRDALLVQEKSVAEDVYEKPISEVSISPLTGKILTTGISPLPNLNLHLVFLKTPAHYATRECRSAIPALHFHVTLAILS